MGGLYLRLDKYLKNSRLIKRRTIAKEACDSGRVLINGKTAKAGSLVHVGISLRFVSETGRIRVKVTEVLTCCKGQAKEMYDLLE